MPSSTSSLLLVFTFPLNLTRGEDSKLPTSHCDIPPLGSHTCCPPYSKASPALTSFLPGSLPGCSHPAGFSMMPALLLDPAEPLGTPSPSLPAHSQEQACWLGSRASVSSPGVSTPLPGFRVTNIGLPRAGSFPDFSTPTFIHRRAHTQHPQPNSCYPTGQTFLHYLLVLSVSKPCKWL